MWSESYRLSQVQCGHGVVLVVASAVLIVVGFTLSVGAVDGCYYTLNMCMF